MKKIILVVAILILSQVSINAQVIVNPQAKGLRVTRVPGQTETPSNYYGVDYPNGVSYVRPAGGFLSIKDSAGAEIAVWAPNQWVRIEHYVIGQ